MLKIIKNSTTSPKLKKVKTGRLESDSWLYALDPTSEEIGRISKLSKISLETLEDSLDEYEIPRVETEKDKLVIILRTPVLDDGVYKTTPLTLVISGEFIVSISSKKINILENYISSKKRIYTGHRSSFFIKICLEVLNDYQRYIASINKGLQADRKRFRQIGQQEIAKLVENEEMLNDSVSALAPTLNAIKKVLNSRRLKFYEADKEMIEDLLIDGEQVLELAQTSLKTIRNLRDGHTTLMTIRLNQVMKLLTYVTVIFTMPMIITGFYGMNVGLPFANSEYAHLIIFCFILFSILILGSLIYFFRKKI
jgi:magnesium transporter